MYWMHFLGFTKQHAVQFFQIESRFSRSFLLMSKKDLENRGPKPARGNLGPPAAAALGNSITHESSVLYQTRLLQIWEPYGAARALRRRVLTSAAQVGFVR